MYRVCVTYSHPIDVSGGKCIVREIEIVDQTYIKFSPEYVKILSSEGDEHFLFKNFIIEISIFKIEE